MMASEVFETALSLHRQGRLHDSAAILQWIGVTDTVADSLDDFVSIATRLARESAWRSLISQRIAENKWRIYRDRSCIAALEEFLDNAVRTGTPVPAGRSDSGNSTCAAEI